MAALPGLTRRTLVRLLDLHSRVERDDLLNLDHDNQTLVFVEQTVWTRHRVVVRGWSASTSLRIGFAGQLQREIRPWIENCERNERRDEPFLKKGFEVELDRPNSRETIVVQADGPPFGHRSLHLVPPTRIRECSARLRNVPSALHLAAKNRRDILRFLATSDPGVSIRLRESFGYAGNTALDPLIPPQLFDDSHIPPARAANDPPTVVLVPVFNAADQLSRLLVRLAEGVGVPHRILLLDDCSDDPRIADMLQDFQNADPDRVTVDVSSENRGFVATVNRGLEIARALGQHVIILNTDTLPPRNWAARLMEPIFADANVASVTPLSNTAEIVSIPGQGVETRLSEDQVDRIDAVAQRFGPAWREIGLPTGIGFAMAMNRRFLDTLGVFDPAFGRGYGEEVDWCQRARAVGGRNILAASVFVGHAGGASFGTAEKSARTATAAVLISDRYPGFDTDVQNWAERAPHSVQRAALSVAWLDAVSNARVPVFMGHVLGGGAEIALLGEVEAALADGAPGVVILRVGGSSVWQVEIRGRGFRNCCRVQDTRSLLELLAPLSARQVIYSCGVGARDPREVPETLLALSTGAAHHLNLRLHDFFPISPSYCLLDSSGRFCGVPPENDKSRVHITPALAGRSSVSLSDWRRLWGRVVERAVDIRVFSRSSLEILLEAYPGAASRTEIVCHPVPCIMPGRIAAGGRSVGVLGGINRAKGADVVAGLARFYNRRSPARRIVILGDLDPNYRLPSPHRVLGRYDRADIDSLAEQNDIGIWLIPSVWPETFSFTTREALATGLPVLTYDLGAQAEAARLAPNGHVLPLQPDDITGLANAIEQHFTDPDA